MAAKKKTTKVHKKRLVKSKKDKIIAGVIAGVAEYFDLDATLLRIIWLIAVAFTGFVPGMVAYLVAIAVVPEK